jgi:tetratricopeptide (TPR) repeat protein
MSRFNEITTLRKQGKLSEAWQQADEWIAELREIKDDEQLLLGNRAMAWVLFDMLKRAVESGKVDDAMKILEQVEALALPASEEMFFENLCWKLGSLISLINKKSAEFPDSERQNMLLLLRIFALVKSTSLKKPSKEATVLLSNLHRGLKKHPDIIQVIEWFGLDCLTPENHKPFVTDDGKVLMSLAEQVYSSYTRALVEVSHVSEVVDGIIFHTGSASVDKKKIQAFIKKLEFVDRKYPDFQFTKYFMYSLFKALDEPEKARKAIIPFVKENSQQYWVWDKLGDAESDVEMRIACYSRALQSKLPAEFFVKIRRKLAALLMESERFDEARTEVDQYSAVIEQNGWRVSNDVKKMMEASWYAGATPKPNNNELYASYRKHTDALLQEDIPEQLIVISYVNTDKGVVHFYVSRKLEGFFGFRDVIERPKVGDVLKVRMKRSSESGHHHVYQAERTDTLPVNDIVIEFEGEVKRDREKAIAFVMYGKPSGIFVESHLVEKHGLANRDKVKGRAMISFNKIRKEWGYKAIRIEKK